MKRYQINLIRQKKQDFADKIIFFFLHYLRYIIVITQIVVIGVFFFRFQVDQEIIDLKESIQQKEEIFKVMKPLIAEVNAAEQSIQNVKKVLGEQSAFLNHIDYFFSVIPSEVVLDKFEIDSTTVLLSGKANNLSVIKTLTAKLRRDKRYKNVVISQVTRAEDGFSFAITITLN